MIFFSLFSVALSFWVFRLVVQFMVANSLIFIVKSALNFRIQRGRRKLFKTFFSFSFFFFLVHDVSQRISNPRVRFIASIRKPVVGPCPPAHALCVIVAIYNWLPGEANSLVTWSLNMSSTCRLASQHLMLVLGRIFLRAKEARSWWMWNKPNKYSILCSFNLGPSGFGWSVCLVCWLFQDAVGIDSFYC